MILKKLLAITLLAVCSQLGAFAQDVALKTNILYDALLTPTLGLEVGVASRWSLELDGSINNWSIDKHSWKQWMVQPEARFWLCQRFAGHFFALHGIGGQYNFGHINIGGHDFLGTDLKQLEDHRRQGWMAGAGVGYGYSWILGKHWNIEAEIGIGWIYTRYDVYRCHGCNRKVEEDQTHNYFGPTKAALNFVYVF
ncbi:MAG: DUF3575 domain-containing protein [Muribaculaceae bacterium]|nr:DUF3575 domain-containing protein [Muribaculaceae bacterium]